MTSPTRSLVEIVIFQVPDGQEENPTKNPVQSVISLNLQMEKPNRRSLCFFLLRSLVTTGILCIKVLIGSTE